MVLSLWGIIVYLSSLSQFNQYARFVKIEKAAAAKKNSSKIHSCTDTANANKQVCSKTVYEQPTYILTLLMMR